MLIPDVHLIEYGVWFDALRNWWLCILCFWVSAFKDPFEQLKEEGDVVSCFQLEMRKWRVCFQRLNPGSGFGLFRFCLSLKTKTKVEDEVDPRENQMQWMTRLAATLFSFLKSAILLRCVVYVNWG
ncbi:hypothetical protein U1Q18_009895 [Sarracenia purpurea var. burkii]